MVFLIPPSPDASLTSFRWEASHHVSLPLSSNQKKKVETIFFGKLVIVGMPSMYSTASSFCGRGSAHFQDSGRPLSPLHSPSLWPLTLLRVGEKGGRHELFPEYTTILCSVHQKKGLAMKHHYGVSMTREKSLA